MTGFSLEWLALRETADARARARRLEARMLAKFADRSHLRIVDLGAGSGSNLRHLAPVLPQQQDWLLVDHAPDLMAEAQRSARSLSHVTARTQACDLASGLAELDLREVDLVTASALMDLVSAAWFDRLVQTCNKSATVLLFVLNYDGRLAFMPRDDADRTINTAFNRHQIGDKGFGPALGPNATDYMTQQLTERNFEVLTESSDWRLSPDDRALQDPLLRGQAAAASEIQPAFAAGADAWLARRLGRLDDGENEILVGHQDLLALPRIEA